MGMATHRDLACSAARLTRTILLLTVGTLLSWAPPASATDPAHQSVNLSLYFPVSTSRDPDLDTNFKLSVIYGRVGSVSGVDLNGAASIVGREFRGLQATLLYSEVRGEFRGVALTGLVNRFGSDVGGLQIAGLVNMDQGRFSGLQYAALFNLVNGGLKGAQISSVFNSSRGMGSFLQLSAVANSHEGAFRGLQLGGINLTTGEHRGIQLGLANVSTNVVGAQAGAINIVGGARGLQIGALNMSRENRGVPVGFLNLDQEAGGVDWTIAGSNLAAIQTSVRTTVNRWYSMLSLGYHDLQGDVEKSWFLGWNYGYSFALAPSWELGVDLGFQHIIPEKRDDPGLNDALHFAIQGRVLAQKRFSPTLAAFVGGGFSLIYSEYSSNAQQETEPHLVAGISLF